MRRFRLRRRRVAALALLGLAAITTTQAATAAAPAERAHIETSALTVAHGERVVLRGAFPGAHNAAVRIRHRAAGERAWRAAAATRTGASGRYRVRVRPRTSGYWRAELAAPGAPSGTAPQGDAGEQALASAIAIDRGTGSERIAVRARIRARVSTRHTLVGRTVRVAGRVLPTGERRRVAVSIGRHREVTRTGRGGRFEVSWRAPGTGTYGVEVRARANRLAAAGRESAGRVTVYRPALASWYGPGLYGNPLACGGVLTPGTLGVAHKTLACGTKLRLRHGNRSVAVRVIDRGPYVGGREFDLTAATRQALGFGSTGTVLSSR